MIPETNTYEDLVRNISSTYQTGMKKAVATLSASVVQTYWEIGRHIVEFEQGGNEKSEYGSKLLDRLSKDLSTKHGKGFGRTNLVYIRKLYIKNSIGATLSHQLSWSTHCELLKIEDDLARGFYENQCINENWTVRELRRQKKSGLFHRLALSKDKEGVLKLAKEGQIIEKPEDLVKDPYILEFLQIPDNQLESEIQLENALIHKLQDFLLELGKGFAFVGRQYRITLNNRHYRVDLVFYHIKLKCYVLIDLKIGDVEHYDIGQMNMYLNYFQVEVNEDNDNQPIGIILSEEKDEILVEYATMNLSNQLFVSKYQLYLPSVSELKQKLQELLQLDIN